MTYYLDTMRQEDVPAVSRVERLCFTNPWPQSAYRRELRKPQSNYYVVLRQRASSRNEPGSSANSSHEGQGLFRLLPFRGRREFDDDRDPIVGFAGMWIMFDEAHVTTIGVHPDHRGRGLGELLLVHLFLAAMERGAEMMTLEVRVSNESAQALYRKYGFTFQGVRQRYYSDNGEDAYIMWSPRIREPEYVERFEQLRTDLLDRLGDDLEEYADDVRRAGGASS